MKTEFRNRAFLPVVMPLAIVGVIVVVVGVVGVVLLYVDRQGAVAVALLVAAGVLVAVALAASQDKLDVSHKGAIGLAGVAPLLIGGLVAAGAIGGLEDAERNINVEPHEPQFIFTGILPQAPVLAAQSATGFCLPDQCGETTTNEWAFTYTPEQIEYAFDNRDTTEHDLEIYAVPPDQLEGLSEALALADLRENYSVITPSPPPNVAGGQAQTYQWTPPVEGEGGDEAVPIPSKAYFVCTVHPSSMWGVVDITIEE